MTRETECGGLLAAPMFCFALVRLVRPFVGVSVAICWAAATCIALFGLELVFVYCWGVLGARQHLGPLFFPLHALPTLGIAPAFACALLLGRLSLSRWWLLAAVLCWFVGAGTIFYQYDVAETLYGIDGSGGPYHWPF